MEEIIKRLDAIETKLDALLYYLSEDAVEEPGGDEYGYERNQDMTL